EGYMSGNTKAADVTPPREQVRSYRPCAKLGRTEFIREGYMSGDTQAADVPPLREQVRSYHF
ncbi:hypothetical protein NLO88_13805, partial [Pseudomonas syringae]|nr:hypothetical protein [Pseudomonas syringae]